MIRVESLDVNGRIPLDQSISLNDDHAQMNNKNTDDKKLSKTSSNTNEDNKNTNTIPEHINRNSLHTNIFSRLLHSELHV